MTNTDDISVPTVSAEEEPYIWTDGARSIALEDNDDTPEEDASVEQIGSDTQGHRRKRRRIQLQDQDTAAISYTHEICALSDNSADEDEDGLESHLERDLRNIAAQREQTIATIDAGESEENTDGEDIAYVGESVRKTISVDEEAKLQQVVEISNDEEEREKEGSKESTGVIEHKKAVEYRCPICFDPPEAALMTPCGHIFCTVCLFQMVNSSRGYRRNGQCALCRKDVKLKEVGLVILRKKRIKKES